MTSDPLLPILATLGFAFLLWFAFGSQWNVRKGHQTMRWLQDGLPLIGERTTLRWLGTSVVQLGITRPKDPFREVEVVLLFEPRDVPFLWGIARLQHRRDLLIFRGRLRLPPRCELELADTDSWTGRDALKKLDMSAWNQAEIGGAGLVLVYQGSEATDLATAMLAQFRQIGVQACLIAVRRSDPHVEVHLLLPKVDAVPARELFELLRETSRQVMSSH